MDKIEEAQALLAGETISPEDALKVERLLDSVPASLSDIAATLFSALHLLQSRGESELLGDGSI